MIAAVFGSEIPSCASPEFNEELRSILSRYNYGDLVIFEYQWMTESYSQDLMVAKFRHKFFNSFWPAYSPRQQMMAAMNLSSDLIFMLPSATIDDEATGHNHSIIEQAVLGVALERVVYSNHHTVLQDRLNRLLENHT